MSDSNLHVITFQEEHGDRWKAEQLVGLGGAAQGEEIMSGVKFTNLDTGTVLPGRVRGVAPASEDEFRAALKEAKRVARLERKLDADDVTGVT